MAIRFRKHRSKLSGRTIMAVRLSETNVADVVAYITKHNGTALNETQIFKGETWRDGEYHAVKLALVQKNLVGFEGKYKKAVRKAFRNDLIVRKEVELPNGKKGYEFERILDSGIADYVVV